MNRAQLAQALSDETGVPRTEALEAVIWLFERIGQSLVDHEEVTIFGFGRFRLFDQKPGHRVNPATGEMQDYPAYCSVRFQPSRDIRSRLSR